MRKQIKLHLPFQEDVNFLAAAWVRTAGISTPPYVSNLSQS